MSFFTIDQNIHVISQPVFEYLMTVDLDLDLESLPRPWSAAGYLRPQSEAAPGDCPPLPSEHNIVHLGDEATADGACARI